VTISSKRTATLAMFSSSNSCFLTKMCLPM